MLVHGTHRAAGQHAVSQHARPNLATLSARRAQQLATVVLVFSRIVEGVIEALSYGPPPEPVIASGRAAQERPLVDSWDDEGWR